MYYPSSENKGTDQLRRYREADLRLCFRICKSLISHDAAQMLSVLIFYWDHFLTCDGKIFSDLQMSVIESANEFQWLKILLIVQFVLSITLYAMKKSQYRKVPKFWDARNLGAVWSGSALFVQTYVSENLGSLR